MGCFLRAVAVSVSGCRAAWLLLPRVTMAWWCCTNAHGAGWWRFRAAWHANREVFEAIASAPGVNLGATDAEGDTVLHYIVGMRVERDRTEKLQFILPRLTPSLLEQPNRKGVTPQSMAFTNGHMKLSHLIREELQRRPLPAASKVKAVLPSHSPSPRRVDKRDGKAGLRDSPVNGSMKSAVRGAASPVLPGELTPTAAASSAPTLVRYADLRFLRGCGSSAHPQGSRSLFIWKVRVMFPTERRSVALSGRRGLRGVQGSNICKHMHTHTCQGRRGWRRGSPTGTRHCSHSKGVPVPLCVSTMTGFNSRHR